MGQEHDEAAVRQIVQQVQDGWNAGSGEGFAAPFAEDADYIVVDGRYVSGRVPIGEGHQYIFDTIYKGSNNTMQVENVRFIRPDVALARVHAHLKFSDGGELREGTARSTWVLTKNESGQWSIAAFQNTPIVDRRR
jgi:uncharacterized protein (TIGR02246 family)